MPNEQDYELIPPIHISSKCWGVPIKNKTTKLNHIPEPLTVLHFCPCLLQYSEKETATAHQERGTGVAWRNPAGGRLRLGSAVEGLPGLYPEILVASSITRKNYKSVMLN